MRIGIVNASRTATEALRRVLEGGGHSVVWTSGDGLDALRRCAAERPDLVLMDLALPGLDGAEATRRIVRETTTMVLVVTPDVEGNAGRVFEAMGHGALDAVKAPSAGADGTPLGGDALLAKVALLSRLAGPRPQPAAAAPPPLVAIGASTGGPNALAGLLAALPKGLGAPVVVIQHVDVQFASGLAGWLASRASLPVAVAVAGERPRPGTVRVAASNDHLVLAPDGTFSYTAEPAACPYRPSVDAFLESAVKAWSTPGVAVLLTGMGRDGARGLLECRSAGWHTIAQDEGTSVLYGMPRAARELGAAVEVLPLPEIAPAIARALERAAAPKGRPR